MLDFSLPSESKSWTVPFLISTQPLSHPIIGYNLIQYLISNESLDQEKLKRILPSVADPSALISQLVAEDLTTDLTA